MIFVSRSVKYNKTNTFLSKTDLISAYKIDKLMIDSTSLNIIFKPDAFRFAICIIFWHHHGILCDLKIDSEFVFFWFLINFRIF